MSDVTELIEELQELRDLQETKGEWKSVNSMVSEAKRLQSHIDLLEAENKQLHADYWTQNKAIADLHNERQKLRTALAAVEDK